MERSLLAVCRPAGIRRKRGIQGRGVYADSGCGQGRGDGVLRLSASTSKDVAWKSSRGSAGAAGGIVFAGRAAEAEMAAHRGAPNEFGARGCEAAEAGWDGPAGKSPRVGGVKRRGLPSPMWLRLRSVRSMRIRTGPSPGKPARLSATHRRKCYVRIVPSLRRAEARRRSARAAFSNICARCW